MSGNAHFQFAKQSFTVYMYIKYFLGGVISSVGVLLRDITTVADPEL